MTEPFYSFGTWVKQRRRALRLTQNELAHLVGCSTELLRKIEADARRPSTQIAERMAPALSLPPHEHTAFVRAARSQLTIDHLLAPAHLVTTPPTAPIFALPALPIRLIGREADLSNLVGLFATDARLVTLIGPPGVGKTTLALAVAQELVQPDAALPGRVRGPTRAPPAHFSDGAVFVALAPISDPALVPQAIARALGVAEQPGRPLIDLLKTSLRSRHLLLLLDNIEQIIDAAPQIAELLAAAPHLRVLSTSRMPLRLRGEHLYSVAPLAVPLLALSADSADYSKELARFAAIELFVQRAQAIRQDFMLTEANQATVASIIRRLDGLPLAIELAASRMRLFSAQTLLERLSTSGLPELRDGPRDAPARQQTLHNAISWSYNLLAPVEQRVFRHVAVFSDGWTLEAAIAIVDGGFASTDRSKLVALIDTLHTLLDHSLITRTGERFSMLETLREYALEQLREAGEEHNARRNHAAYVCTWGAEAETQLQGPEQALWLDRIALVSEDLRGALTWMLNNGEYEWAAGLAGALRVFWIRRNRIDQGRQWLERILSAHEQISSASYASVAYARAGIAIETGDLPGARIWLNTCLALYRQLASQRSIATTLADLGHVETWLGNGQTDGMVLLNESLAIFRELTDLRGIAYALSGLGWIANIYQQYSQAKALHSEALALRRNLSDGLVAIAESLGNLSVVAGNANDYHAAVGYNIERIALHQQLGDSRGAMIVSRQLGYCYVIVGDLARAHAAFEQSLAMSRLHHELQQSVLALNALSYTALETGDWAGAMSHSSAAIATAHRSEDPLTLARANYVRGLSALANNHLELAKRCFTEQLAQGRACDDRKSICRASQGLGMTARRQADVEHAQTHLQVSLNLSEAHSVPTWSVWILAELALVYRMRNELALANEHAIQALTRLKNNVNRPLGCIVLEAAAACRAASDLRSALLLYSAAAAQRTRISAPIWPVDLPAYQQQLAQARATLGNQAFEDIWAEGQAYSMSAAITLIQLA